MAHMYALREQQKATQLSITIQANKEINETAPRATFQTIIYYYNNNSNCTTFSQAILTLPTKFHNSWLTPSKNLKLPESTNISIYIPSRFPLARRKEFPKRNSKVNQPNRAVELFSYQHRSHLLTNHYRKINPNLQFDLGTTSALDPKLLSMRSPTLRAVSPEVSSILATWYRV